MCSINCWHRLAKEHFNHEEPVPPRVREFLTGALPGWDDLLMDYDDPEQRTAELERQLDDARATPQEET